jgi:hypothetical protein
VKNKVMLALLDSGSSHSFVNSDFVKQAGLDTVATTPKTVRLANGEILVFDKMVHNLEWWCQGHTLVGNMILLDLGAYDAILGYDWLKVHSPMNYHWENRTIEFQRKGKTIALQGVKPVSPQLQSIEPVQL